MCEQKDNNLVIIGNGFDVNHGLPSSYAHFKSWLRLNGKPLYDFLERYIDVTGEWWHDFEKNLSEFNVPKLIRETPMEKRPRDPRLLPDFSTPAAWKIDEIREKITKNFTEWVKTIDGQSAKQTIDLPKASLYISFNYTDILERVYGINEHQILYIHGKASRGEDLIYGHGKDENLIEHDVMQKYGLYESDDFFKAGTFGDAEYEVILHISFLEKNPYIQLTKYDEMLRSAITEAETVWVYGLSFSEVDVPYIEWMVERNRNLYWRVSWHTEDDKKRIKNTFESLRVREYELFYL